MACCLPGRHWLRRKGLARAGPVKIALIRVLSKEKEPLFASGDEFLMETVRVLCCVFAQQMVCDHFSSKRLGAGGVCGAQTRSKDCKTAWRAEPPLVGHHKASAMCTSKGSNDLDLESGRPCSTCAMRVNTGKRKESYLLLMTSCVCSKPVKIREIDFSCSYTIFQSPFHPV